MSTSGNWIGSRSKDPENHMVLVYSTAEYGTQMWINSSHVKRIDTQLSEAMSYENNNQCCKVDGYPSCRILCHIKFERTSH